MRNFSPIIFLILLVVLFFNPFIFQNKLPIPADTIIGLYHPFRDLYSKNYPNGIPFKNFLITDPVRQQYPWKKLSIILEEKRELPLWNPYNFAGVPLLANFQASSFYPLNFLFFLFHFNLAWSFLIFILPLLSGLFLYLYLNNLKLNKFACLLGSISWSYCGFSIAWLEWGTVTHVALWLPLILLSIDKIFFFYKNKEFPIFLYSIIFLFSLISSFFAGHLQTFFYLFVLSTFYLFARWFQLRRNKKILILFTIYYLLFTIITAIQWAPTFQFINLSSRITDQSLHDSGWFIPWQNLIQFLVPDFFGNPTTLNYWGIWNYAEFIGYIGIIPFFIGLYGLFFRHDKKTLFFGTFFFLSLIFSLPTFFAKLPYILNIPFVSTSQPTRLLFLTDFSLAVLAALGFDYFLKKNNKRMLYILGFFAFIFSSLWLFVIFGKDIFNVSLENILVSKQNLYLPTVVFIISALLLVSLFKAKNTLVRHVVISMIILLVIFDLFRFGWKFTPFTQKEYLFPNTKVLKFLQKQTCCFRIMTTDSRILPPNFSIIYKLETIDGYDPLYLKNYGELIAALERNKPDIKPPFGFNRIINPKNYESKIVDLLGVKYILSLSDLSSKKLIKVFQEGETRVYENKNVMPRVFFVDAVEREYSKQKIIEGMFDVNKDLRKVAIIEDVNFGFYSENELLYKSSFPLKGSAKIMKYSENEIIIKTKSNRSAFLVLTDVYYPTWKVKIDRKEEKIYVTNYTFRGIFVPAGEHEVKFYVTLF